MTVSKNFVVKRGLEVGGDTLFANSVTDRVGVGTTNPTSTLTVKGNTSLETLNVSGVSTFTTSTFSGNVGIGTTNLISALTVAGSGTSTSQLYVVGISTFQDNAYIASDNRLYFGDEKLSISYQITPSSSNYIESFDHTPINIVTENLTVGASDGETYANFKINSSVSLYYDNSKKFETSGLGVTVTGVTSTTYLYATGISTFINGPVFIGSGTTTGTVDQKLQVTGGGYFSGSVGIGITNPSNTLTVVGSGTSTAQLYVTGFSTFVGYSTFRDYVNIEDGLNVLGVSTFIGRTLFKGSVFGDTIIEDGNIYNTTGFSTFFIGEARGVDFPFQSGQGKVRLSSDDFAPNANSNNGRIGFYDSSNNLTAVWESDVVTGSIYFYNYTNSGTENITISAGSSVVLQHGGTNTKLQTLGTGVTVTGTTFTNQLNVSGISTFNDAVRLPDNISIQLGNSQDLNISHDGTASNIEAFNNTLRLKSSNNDIVHQAPVHTFKNGVDNETLAVFTQNGSVELYYDNSKKFETAGAGVTVTGTTFTNQLNVSGISTFIGSVGIGSTLPTSKLTVDGDVNISGIVTAPTFVGNLTGTATTATTVDILNTNGLSTLYYPTFVESRTDGQIVRADVDLTYRTDDNVLTVPNIQLSSSGLTVGTGGTVITTTSGGSVGVGTINPVSRLSVVGGDASVGINTSQGVILTSANGNRYRLFVENDGTLKTVAI